MSSNEIAVAELGRIVTGRTPPTLNAENFGGDFLFVTPSDLDWKSYYCRSTGRTVSSAVHEAFGRSFVSEGAVMVTCIGNTIGKCAIASATCLTNQQINSIIPSERRHSAFIYYLMLNNVERIRQVGIGGGAATPIVNKSTFSRLRFQVPEKTQWEGIGKVLCAYDDLIENNRRRIALLEQSARLLYREWFVHLRFPGHEHVKVVDGVPEGWERKRLVELAEMTMGQSPASQHYNADGVGFPFHQGVTDFGVRYVEHRTWCDIPGRMAQPGDILFSVRAPVGRLNLTLDQMVIGRGLSAMRSREGHQSMLFYQLANHFFKEDMIGGGAIFASVTKKDLENQRLLQPNRQLAAEFNQFASEIDRQIQILVSQNAKLRQARDLLLPRLMRGEIEV